MGESAPAMSALAQLEADMGLGGLGLAATPLSNPDHPGVAPPGGATAAPPEWAQEMRIGGVIYAVSKEKAVELGWELLPPVPGASNNLFVRVKPTHGRIHALLQIPALETEYDAPPIEAYSHSAMERLI